MAMSALCRNIGVVGLLGVAAVHANWARGSSWPLADQRQLALTVAGREEMPDAAACLVVAGLLGVAAGLVGVRPRAASRPRQVVAVGVPAMLALRGTLGLAGLLPEQAASEAFAYWDRRLYSPLCLVLAGCCAVGLAAR